MANSLSSICVFCGSSSGDRPEYADAARALAGELVKRCMRLVYGGGRTGLMGIVADAVLAAGGEVTGVMPRSLVEKEISHKGLTELHVVESMHERKALMAARSDAFIAMPGGFGTFEEFCEMITWTQLGIHRKPCGLLNVAGYYDPLLALFDRAVGERFLKPENRSIVIAETEPVALIDALIAAPLPLAPKWITPAQS